MMKFFLIAALLLPLLSGPALADDDGNSPAVIAALCAGGAAEGAYHVNMDRIGTVSIYILCQGATRMTAAMSNSEADNPVEFAYTAVDGDTLTFGTHPLGAEDAPTIGSNFTDGRIQVSIASLAKGVLNGSYRSLYTLAPYTFNVPRAVAFPNLLQAADHSADFTEQFNGYFKLESDHFLGKKLARPVWLINDVINGIQRIVVNVSDGVAFTLGDGLVASTAGNVFYATAGVDPGSMGLRPTQHIRGRILSKNEIEFYYFTSTTGWLGPFRAVRGVPPTHY